MAEDEDRFRGRGYDRGQEAEHKQVEIMDKEVNQAARDSDDALVYCVKNMVEDRIMDSGASFHATYCKEELERFKLRSDKVRLADDKTLDIASVGDVVLKTSFGTSWTLKDARYIPSLKRMLISVGQLDKEGYHVGFRDQQWKVTKGSLVVAHGNKRGSLYIVEDWYEHVSFQRQCSKCIEGRYLLLKFIQKAVALHLLHQSEDPATMILLSKTAAGVIIVMLKMVPETPLQFGVVERLSRTFRAESTGNRAVAPNMLWADSVSTTYLIYRTPYVLIGLRIPEESATYLSSLTKPIQKIQVVLVDIPENLAENDSIVAEHGLSSKITQSLCWSLDTSEESKNNGSFKDSRRSDEEYSKDEASSKEGGFGTPHVRRSTRESRAPWKYAIIEEMVSLKMNEACSLVRLLAGKNASQSLWMFMVKEKQDGSKRYKTQLMVKGFQQKRRVDYNEIFSPVVKMTTISWAKLVQILISEGSLSVLKILGTKSLAMMFTSTGVEGRIAGCKPNPTSFSTGRVVGTIVQFSTGRAAGTIVQLGTSLSTLAQSLIISLWFDPMDCHDYHSR
ncbi:retrovirus-related pol polyprotein from transposon TNT 1-94 [Tanacetum coccineum]